MDSIKSDPRNPNRIDAATRAGLAAALAEFGDLSGIVINRRTGLLVGGHQRADILAGARLDVRDLAKPEPDGTVARGNLESNGRRYAVRVVDWPEDRAHAALLAANRYGRRGHDDAALLQGLLAELDQGQTTDAGALLADLTGFDKAERDAMASETRQDDTYTNKIVAPVYIPKGEKPPVSALIDRTKTDQLIAQIDAAEGLPEEVAQFLRFAAERHTIFNFRQIAEFYCHAAPATQNLMERSGLVIIDFHKAIEYGFVHLTERLGALADAEGFSEEGAPDA